MRNHYQSRKWQFQNNYELLSVWPFWKYNRFPSFLYVIFNLSVQHGHTGSAKFCSRGALVAFSGGQFDRELIVRRRARPVFLESCFIPVFDTGSANTQSYRRTFGRTFRERKCYRSYGSLRSSSYPEPCVGSNEKSFGTHTNAVRFP